MPTSWLRLMNSKTSRRKLRVFASPSSRSFTNKLEGHLVVCPAVCLVACQVECLVHLELRLVLVALEDLPLKKSIRSLREATTCEANLSKLPVSFLVCFPYSAPPKNSNK